MRTEQLSPPVLVRPAAAPGRAPRPLGARMRVAAAVASALTLGLSGGAWGLYRDVTAGITTTDVIAGSRNGGEENILLVGVDSRRDAQGNALPQAVLDQLHGGPDTGVLNSDTIIVLHVPAGGAGAVAFSIPRDSYVDIPGYRRDKINAAYPAVKAAIEQELVKGGARDPREIDAEAGARGRTALIGAVEGVTGLSIDHYAELNLVGFATLTTAIGGVEVCLKAPADDVLSGAHLPAGPQTIEGADALAFVRQRHGLPQGDLSRIRRQQVFLAAVAEKTLAAGTLTSPAALTGLVEVAQRSVVIDSGWDLLGFARQAADVAKGNLAFVTIPTSGRETNSRGDVLLVDRAAVHDFVDRTVAAQQEHAAAPPQAAAVRPAPAPAPFTIVASRYVVDVGNGSGTDGLGAQALTSLRGQGFLRGTLDNAPPTGRSVVRFTGADHDAAAQLAAHLGGIATAEIDDGVPGHLQVLLGADFNRSVLLAPPASAATRPQEPRLDAPLTAAGVPCVD